MAIFGSGARRISFEGKDPTRHYGVTFKLDCRIPSPGVYVVEFVFEDEIVEQQLITVR